MDRADFESLIARMEDVALERPDAYRRKVMLTATFGYLYLAFLVVLLTALTIAAIWSTRHIGFLGVKIAIAVVALGLAVVRSLWVRSAAPIGIRVARADAPQIFRLVDALRVRLRSEEIHVVLVTPDFNAGISQVPRLGVFGWHKNYLVLGLQLMKALTVEQFKSVLAHEMGHLSGGHAKSRNWIYRLRITLTKLEARFDEEPRWGSGVIRAFFKWYVPYFTALSFPFARSQEYEADAVSVRVTNKQHAAQALTAVHLIGSYLRQNYWPEALQAKKSSTRAVTPFSGFVAAAVRGVPESQYKTWFAEAMNDSTSHEDTHPALKERLKAMGATAEFAPPEAGQSADKLLGPLLARVESLFDSAWSEAVAKQEPKPFFAEAPKR